MRRSGPSAQTVQPPLRKMGGRRIVHTEKHRLVELGGRYVHTPRNIMMCVGM